MDIDEIWEDEALPALAEYTRIQCLSPAFDPDWAARGEIDRAAALLAEWCTARPIPGLTVDVINQPGRTPLVRAEVPGRDPHVVAYGHLDKQPPLGEWAEGLGPYAPVRRGDRLYGRGTADDGYATFAALIALQCSDPPHTTLLIEASEESGSPDLETHLDALELDPGLVICLDSGAASFDRLWLTTSLRGNLVATVRVDVLTEGVHSGAAGGAVPSSFRILRQLLSRLEDERTGEILLPELHGPVPDDERARLAALEPEPYPTVPGLRLSPEPALQTAWMPALALTGIDGVPSLVDGGNVLRPFTTAKISIRLPPNVDATLAGGAVRAALTHEPPQGARVTVQLEHPADGWVAPPAAPWLADALDEAGRAAFGCPPGFLAEGGTIPFLTLLGRRFPTTQMVVTGVLGPGSNAHGPNEFLDLGLAKGLTAAVAHILDRLGS